MPEKPRAVTREQLETFVHLHKLSIKGHAGQALLSAAILDQELRTAILKKMRPKLANKKQERLFDGFGPLSEFAAKIEVAYALGQMDDDTYGKLRIIKEIRDKFAHLPKECTFFSPEIRLLINKFQFKGKATYPSIFGEMAELCFNRLAEKTAESVEPAPSPDTEQ
ncbi:hypothetical protein JQ634_27790 [Bradyrhizobium sp. AUGA SZCCT0240]|uniref:MltR family transcriptional regulator n=1 Tax=unclassified Bradyrhizobium TaxID=2631580 RepID=UPI001BA89D23|nr:MULTISPECIES: MltR family transcriptional regulator [unclassified Bradyrhizobium]MBR1196223.1 hypothetical protein [Bradyrhizobium sp. AUGA SZCCT0158]MBR1243191.1 hypothetical protein [Bradyrhizobium sp. AUGA SZCCT0274]MBR1257478.1 hypothetical protein [Bradyrhizobium sp. AUGA SZCCT0240]